MSLLTMFIGMNKQAGGGGGGPSGRALWFGGWTGARSDVIDYIQIPTTGDATDFGDLVQGINQATSCSSDTRGCVGGGSIGGYRAGIDYVTIATTGNTTYFGDLVVAAGGG